MHGHLDAKCRCFNLQNKALCIMIVLNLCIDYLMAMRHLPVWMAISNFLEVPLYQIVMSVVTSSFDS